MHKNALLLIVMLLSAISAQGAEEEPAGPVKELATIAGVFQIQPITVKTRQKDGTIATLKKYKITTPHGRHLYSGWEVIALHSFTDGVYLVNTIGVLKYYPDRDQSDDRTLHDKIFVEQYRAPHGHIIPLISIRWGERQYCVVYKQSKDREGKTISIFRGLLRFIDKGEYMVPQYIPYTDLPASIAATLILDQIKGDKTGLRLKIRTTDAAGQLYEKEVNLTKEENFEDPII